MIDKLSDWGECTEEQKKEFTQVYDSFSNELKEALKSLSNNITLEPYDPHWENDAKNIHSTKAPNQEMISGFERIFNDWSGKIQ